MIINNHVNKKYIIFLMGPTASGKSILSMQLQKYLPIELISVDSALVYHGMDIGTAKPNHIQLLKHPLRLINLRDPKDCYSVADFRHDALQAIEEILEMRKIPLLVGGTMLYYHILLHGISHLPKSNIVLRQNLLKHKNYKNSRSLHQYLSYIDYESAQSIHFNDIQRILRALEVCLITGTKYSILKKKKNNPLSYHVIPIAIIPDRKYLYKKINIRLYHMLKHGFEDEVRKLFNRGDLNLNLPSIRCIGYRHMWLYFMNRINYNEMIEYTIISTRQLVKRQITWLKKWNKLHILNSQNIDILIQQIIEIIYKNVT